MAVADRPPEKLEELVEFVARQHVRTACLFCDWNAEGPFADVKEAAATHRREVHPSLGDLQPRYRGPRSKG